MSKLINAMISLLILSTVVSCNNHRVQSSYRFNEGTRLPPEGTMAQEIPETPFKLERAALEKGKVLFEINCAACHGHDGSGNGIAVKRGLTPPDSLYEKDLANKGEDYYFETMTNGIGQMPSFRRKLSPAERSAVAAYIMALRLSRSMKVEDLDPEDKKNFL